MSTRRAFLGSILGTLVGTTINFPVVKPDVVPIPDLLGQYELIIRAFRQNAKDLLKYKAISVTVDDEEFIGTACIECKRDGNNLDFKFHPIKLTQAITLKGIKLVNDQNTIVQTKSFSEPVSLVNTDTLNLYYNIGLT